MDDKEKFFRDINQKVNNTKAIVGLVFTGVALLNMFYKIQIVRR